MCVVHMQTPKMVEVKVLLWKRAQVNGGDRSGLMAATRCASVSVCLSIGASDLDGHCGRLLLDISS